MISSAVRRTPPRQRTFAAEFTRQCASAAERHHGRAWPAKKWQADPVGFAYFILGVELWEKERQILEAIRDNPRVAVAGGRKIGKDFTLSVAALWWYASYEDARVFMTATTARQVDGILYREVRRRVSQTGRCVACKKKDPNAPPPCPHSAILTGRVGEMARTGIVAEDLREIRGATSDSAEGMAGTSGENILAIIDEASGYPDPQHVAIRGNLAASGCKEVLISNPTKAYGFFFEAFHIPAKMDLYARIQVSTLENPNVIEGRTVFPGLGSRAWVEEQKQEWGEDSPLFKVHVLGQFVLNEQGAIFQVGDIADAEARWEDTTAEGQLTVGIDPAGEGGDGDESGFAIRRGKKLLAIRARRGMSPEAHLIEALGIMADWKTDADGGNRPRLVIDRDGQVGAAVWGVFVGYRETHPDAFDLTGVRGGERAQRDPATYDRVRDELMASLKEWFKDGGAIPTDAKLAKELNAFRWVEHISNRAKVSPKDRLREVLGRSPDRADALALACWGPKNQVVAEANQAPANPPPNPYNSPAETVFDPYAGMGNWR